MLRMHALQEFSDVLIRIGAGLTPKDVAAIINEVDRDGDGEINKSEFAFMVRRHLDHGHMLGGHL